MRYQGKKRAFWKIFSEFIRKRDCKKGYGYCISCHAPITFETSDAGHFVPAGECGIGLLFDEQNINAQCRKCNRFDGGNRYEYGLRLDTKYGIGTAEKLWKRKWTITHEFTDKEYQQKIEEYKTKIKNL